MGIRAHGMRAWLNAIAITAGLLFGVVGACESASAEVTFCPSGTGAGQCNGPNGVAVDTSSAEPSSGHVYVADSRNNRIDVFESNGQFLYAIGWGVADGSTAAFQKCAATCFKGLSGEGNGEFASPAWVATDNDAASPSHHDFYVGTDKFRVQKFDPDGNWLLKFGESGTGACKFSSERDPLAVGPEGNLFVADSPEIAGVIKPRIEKFGPSGTCLGESALPEPHTVKELAVDSEGKIYVSYTGLGNGIWKYTYGEPAAAFVLALDLGTETTALSTDGAGNLVAAQREGRKQGPPGDYRVLTEYDSAGGKLHRWGYGVTSRPIRGAATYSSANGKVFGAEEEGSGIRYFDPPVPGPIAVAPSIEVTTGNTKATLSDEINPEGKATKFHVEYVDQAGFEASGFATAKRLPASPSEDEEVGSDFNLHGRSVLVGCEMPTPQLIAEGKCLSPETQYHFRFKAGNTDGEGAAEGVFTTKAALEFGSVYASEVGVDGARLSAEVNPLGIPTSGHFEYVDQSDFEASGYALARRAPAGELAFGSGEALATQSATVGGLAPHTRYRLRFVATDPLIEPAVKVSQEIAFETFAPSAPEPPCANDFFRSGAGAALADCRAYEMVSPLEKGSADILALNEPTRPLPASLDESAGSGGRFAYGTSQPFGDAASAPYTSQYVATRDPSSGWSSEAINPPRGQPLLGVAASLDTEFKYFSEDLCEVWLRTVAEAPLTPAAVEGFPNVYRHRGEECGGGGYEAITTAAPPNSPPLEYFPLELQGVAGDGAAAIYVANDNLTPDAAPQPVACEVEKTGTSCQMRLYYAEAGSGRAPHLVCILPNGEAEKESCGAGTPAERSGKTRETSLHNAISNDGTRIFWGALNGPSRPLYLRVNPGQAQSAIAGGQCSEPEKACTIAVSKKAEELSGGGSAQYWTAARDGSRVIFSVGSDLYEAEIEEEAGHLVAKTQLLAHKSAGLLGASEDASLLYLTSEETLTGANGEGRSPTAGKPNLYLDREGTLRFVETLAASDVASRFAAVNSVPVFHAARVSADGRFAAFTSQASPFGYDNKDATSGKPDAEAYLYEADANAGAGKLLCASCNPTGARPAGEDIDASAGEFWAAAHIPVWENALYGSRALSADGKRLFFEAADSLVPRDTNGVSDVYQWEAPGAGGCSEESPDYSAPNGGCLSLISSGQSGRKSEFLDASPSGDDVFFATLSSLVSQDFGLIDIYDARVGGGFPAPEGATPECEGEACQSPPPPPQAAPPASSTYEGPGNLSEPAEKPRSCPKGKVRRKGRCVKKHPSHPHKGHKKAGGR